MTRSLDTGMPQFPTTQGDPIYTHDFSMLGGPITGITRRTGAFDAGTDVRAFDTGATRDTDTGKFDYEAFLSPLVLERYAAYMHSKRQINGQPMRDGDNWQRGIPLTVYMKSLWRHFVDLWKEHRGIKTVEGVEDALCAVIFNASGYLHEHLKAKG